MLDYMPEEIFALHIDPIEDVRVEPLPRMYSRELEVGVFALNGAASGVRFVAVGSKSRPGRRV